MAGKYKEAHLDWDSKETDCARTNCEEPVDRKVFVHVHGRVRDLSFCRTHADEEAQDERLYRLGL